MEVSTVNNTEENKARSQASLDQQIQDLINKVPKDVAKLELPDMLSPILSPGRTGTCQG